MIGDTINILQGVQYCGGILLSTVEGTTTTLGIVSTVLKVSLRSIENPAQF